MRVHVAHSGCGYVFGARASSKNQINKQIEMALASGDKRRRSKTAAGPDNSLIADVRLDSFEHV